MVVSGCDRLKVLDYNVHPAETFKPASESEQAALLECTKPHAGTGIETYKT